MALRSLPAGVGFKPPRAALAEDRCRERRGKSRVHVARQVWIEKASTSESPFMRRYLKSDIKTGSINLSRDEPIRHPAYRMGGVRRRGGASSIRALLWNCGNSES